MRLTALLPGVLAILLALPSVTRAQQESSISADSTQGSSEDSSQNSTQGTTEDSSRGPSDPPSDGGGGGGATSDSNSTNESFQETTDNSTEGTKQETRDSSRSQTNHQKLSGTAAALIVGSAIVVAGVGVMYTYRDRISVEAPAAPEKLAGQLREYHALVLHDLTYSSGPLFDSWLHQMNVSDGEREHFYKSLGRSPKRIEMMRLIDGEISPEKAQRFAFDFVGILSERWNEARAEELLHAVSRQ